MTSEIRTNSLTSRAGLSTVTLTDSGPMFSGITTFVDNSTFSVGTGGTIHAPATNTLNIGVNNTESLRIDSNSNLKVAGIVTATHFYGSGANLTGIQVGGASSLSFNDNVGAYFGNSQDLKIYHDSSHSYLHNTNGNLILRSNYLTLRNAASDQVSYYHENNGTTMLYYAGSSKIRTTSTGIRVIDDISIGDKMFHEGDTDTAIRFPAADTITAETAGSERLRIDSAGRCIVGGGTHAGGSALVVKGGNQNTYSTIGMFSNHTNPAADTLLSQIRFGSNATAVGADIRVYADAAWGTNDYPTRIQFYTTPDGSNSRQERLRITSEGYLKIVDNGVTQTNTTLSYQSEGAFITHYTARTTAGGDRYRRMLDIASVGANPHGSSIRLLTSPDDTNPAVTVERVRIDHNGRVGINKTQPRAMLSVKAERSATPRFGIDGHYSDSSYTQCSWDDSNGLYTVLGVNHELDANGNDAIQAASLHSASIMLDGRSGNIRFNVKVNSGSTPTELMRIRDTGCVHIGNSLGSAAAGRLQVVEERGGNQTNDCNAYFETNANDWNIKTYYNSTGTHYHISFIEQGSFRGGILGNDGSNVNYQQGSDYRWKENIVEMTGTEGIDICKKLKPSKYNWIENREVTGKINTVDGFIAHEVVEAGVLGAVHGEKDAVNEDGSIKGQMLDYGQMTPVLAAAIKGLITKVETLEQDNIALRARVTNLEGN